MGRLILLLAALALIVSRDVRAHLSPHVRWALDPAYEWAVRSRLSEIVNAIEGDAALGRPVPATSADLRQFLRARYHQDSATRDPWEEPFFLVRERGVVRVASAGRDRRPRTADDVVSRPLSPRSR